MVDDYVVSEPDGSVDFGSLPPKYADLPGYEHVMVESPDGWQPPDWMDATEGDNSWTIEDGGEIAGLELNGQVRLSHGYLKPELNGPPEIIKNTSGEYEFLIPLGLDGVERVPFGEFECRRCGTTIPIPQPGFKNGGDVQKPQECDGCERQGPFAHVSGSREDITGSMLLRLLSPPWDPPSDVEDELDGLWDDIREHIWDHWCAHPDDDFMYEGLAAWAMTTWVRPELRAVAHLIVKGRFGGGKTRLLNTLRRVSYRSATYGSVTESSTFRFIDRLDATPMFTEFHRWEKEERKDLETLLMLGYNRGEYVQRNEEVAGEWIPQNFDPFTSIGVGTQYGLPDDIKSRSITIHTAKRHRDVVEEFDERSERRARKLRNRLLYLRWRLLTSKEWAAAVDRASEWLDEHDISDRCKQILKGMTAMAVIFDKLDDFEEFALEMRRQVKVAQSESTDAILIDIVRDLALRKVGEKDMDGQQVIGDPWSVVKIYYSEVVERYNELTGEERTNSWFGHAVDRFDLDTGRDTATFIRDDELHDKLKRLVENAELEWREPDPSSDAVGNDAGSGSTSGGNTDPRYWAKKVISEEFSSGDTVSVSNLLAKLSKTPAEFGGSTTPAIQIRHILEHFTKTEDGPMFVMEPNDGETDGFELA